MQNSLPSPGGLRRQIGLGAAVMLGLGSMVGTGVFVSLGLGAGLVGPAVIGAIGLAGLLAMCNGLSSAQLAAAYPVSGGTYEYAHRVGWPALGAVAGAMFLVAKSASCATAALGLAGYVLNHFDAPGLMVPGALAVIAMLTVVVLEGISRTNAVNTVVVTVTLVGLGGFVAAGWGEVEASNLSPFVSGEAAPASHGPLSRAEGVPDRGWAAVFHAVALMFVAYTGYGRIATLGEEVHHPRRTIPIAIIVTVCVCIAVYAAVAYVGVGTVGAGAFSELARGGAPLEAIADDAGFPAWTVWAVTIAAVTALLGVVLNLLLGLSRVALGMGRRGHLPRVFAKVDDSGGTPAPAVLLVAGIVAALACVGSIRAAWSLSAVTVLVYYAVTNAAALRLAPEHRRLPRVVSWLGLLGCLGVGAFVEPVYWAFAGGVIVAALGWHAIAVRGGGAAAESDENNPNGST